MSEMARRSGVPPATLRAWERRYGLFDPGRTPGGHRVYTAADLARVRRVVAFVDAGVPLGAAVRQILDSPGPARDEEAANPYVDGFWEAAQTFDEARARRVLLEASAALAPETLLDNVLVPLLRRVGIGWQASPRNIAREHFTSTLVRASLLHGLADRVDRAGPLVLAAAPAGETHDIGVIMAAVALATDGWHPVVLGAQTPWASLESLLAELRPQVVLLGAQLRPPAARLLATWTVPTASTVVFGGTGFREGDVGRVPQARYHGGPYGTLPQAMRDALAPAGSG
jgi:DNA-binding transcriptional MerR regulator